MHQLKSHKKLQSKDKEPTPSFIDVASSWVSNEVYENAAINPKPKTVE